MDLLTKRLELKDLIEWIKYKRYLYHNEGKSLLNFYSNNMIKLLTSIYPNYPFHSSSSSILLSFNSNEYFKSIENQRKFMEELYMKFQLISLDDWMKISKKMIDQNGGYSLIHFYYSNDFHLLLSSIFPFFPWPFNSPDYNNFKNNLNINIDNKNLNIDNNILNDENNINNVNSNNNNNNNIKITNNDIYNNKLKNEEEQMKEKRREYIEELFIKKFKLKTMEEWKRVGYSKLTKKGSKSSFLSISNSSDIPFLFYSLYPFYPWNFFDFSMIKIANPNLFFKSKENQKKFLENLFIKLNLNLENDWKLITRNLIVQNGGYSLITFYYSDNLEKMFFSLFPFLSSSPSPLINNQNNNLINNINKNFNDDLNKNDLINNKSKEKSYFEKKEKQREFMEKLFIKLNLISIKDRMKIRKKDIINHGGKHLLIHYYNFNLPLLLSSIFSEISWKFNQNLKYFFNCKLEKIENQKFIMDILFNQLNLSKLEEWLFVDRKNFIKNGGKKLLVFYSFNFADLLTNVYPFYPWTFSSIEKNENENFSLPLIRPFIRKYDQRSFDFIRSRLKKIQEKYWIKEKKDWYRLPLRLSFLHLPSSLLLSFPPSSTSFNHIYNNLNNKGEKKRRGEEEGWNEEKFCITKKKSKQRLLFAYLQRDIYKHQQIIEEYHLPSPPFPSYPHNNKNNNNKNNNLNNKNKDVDSNDYDDDDKGSYYYDIFIPSLNLAFEYQGEQHYDEIPSISSIQVAQSRDIGKLSRSSKLSVHIIFIPYWWDLSLASLLSSILSSSPSHLRF